MKLIFDRGLESEKSLAVDRVSERPLFGRLNASKSGLVADGTPDLSAFTEEAVSSVAVVPDEGGEIGLVGNYARISDLSVTYEEGGRSYHVSVALEPAQAEEE